jgi:MinD-like ATPase involved in chromosome partitioning or flagellar assembly
MGKIIALHSYKGGTGKTLLSVNLAATYAKQGKALCLLDMDFRAPSLHTVFQKNDSEYWLNDYLNGACEIDRVLIDLSNPHDGNGRLLVGLADPTTEAIREMSAKDRKWEMRALGRLLSLKNSLLNDLHLDFLIFDTSPGLQYSSINAIVSADGVLVVSSIDRSDVKGTQRMIQELYELFDKKTGIVLNKVPIETLSSEKERGKFFKRFTDLHNLPIIGAIPCFCDVLRAGGTFIFTKEKPEHPFTNALEKIAKKLDEF